VQARELGADISYCRRKAACERNKRTTSGLGRMSKLHGLPGSVFRKTRLLLAGIFPHALHAAEASYAPKTVLQRLRSGAARAIGCRRTGASPWLACLLASNPCVDPEFVLVLNRIQLFRQLIKELPALSQFFFDGLLLHSRRPRPTRLLVTALDALTWLDICRGWIFYGHRRQSVSCVFDSSPTCPGSSPFYLDGKGGITGQAPEIPVGL
jgi:hypothetical protein